MMKISHASIAQAVQITRVREDSLRESQTELDKRHPFRYHYFACTAIHEVDFSRKMLMLPGYFPYIRVVLPQENEAGRSLSLDSEQMDLWRQLK
jgi:hypothetical protein